MDTPWLKAAKAKVEEFQRELWAEHEGDPPSELWHYTSDRGFNGIVGSDPPNLRVFDTGRLRNDPTEGKYALEISRTLIERKSVPPDVKDVLGRSGSFFGRGEEWYQYVVCFSEEENSENQWTKYADKGKGFALGIDYQQLFERAPNNYAVLKILYDKDEQKKKVGATINHVIHTARELEVPKRDLADFWLTGPGAQSLMVSGLHIKNPGEGNDLEKEWRVLMLRPERDGAKQAKKDGSDRHFLELPLTSQLLRRVVLGPDCELPLGEAQSFLREHGFPETKVEKAPRAGATTTTA